MIQSKLSLVKYSKPSVACNRKLTFKYNTSECGECLKKIIKGIECKYCNRLFHVPCFLKRSNENDEHCFLCTRGARNYAYDVQKDLYEKLQEFWSLQGHAEIGKSILNEIETSVMCNNYLMNITRYCVQQNIDVAIYQKFLKFVHKTFPAPKRNKVKKLK